jgi:hypothetical protein
MTARRHAGTVLFAVALLLAARPLLVAADPEGWDPERRLTRSAAASTTSINFARSVALDEAGRVHIAWVEQGPGSAELLYKRSIDAGATWGPPVRLLASPNQAFNPSIAAADGFVMVVWQDTRPGGTHIYARRSIDGGVHWQDEVRLTDHGSGSPSLALEGPAAHLVYGRPLGANDIDIFYRRSADHGATWSDEVRVSDIPGNSWVPTVAATGSHVYVAWSDTTHSPEPCCLEEEYFARSTDGGLTFGVPVRLTVDPPGALANSWAPSLAADGADVWIVWFDQRSGRWEVYTRRSQDHGQTWSPERQLTQATGAALRPSIAQRASDLYVAYWDNPPGEAEEIFLLHSADRGATWQVPARLTTAPGSSTLASVAAGRHGVHVVWSDARDGNPEVYHTRLPGEDVPLGNGLIAYNRTVNGAPQLFAANADGSGERQLTFEGENTYPAWSKDGSRLMFTSKRGGADELWVMEPDGSNPTRLSSGEGDFLGDWSFDGTRVAFTSVRSGPPEIWIMNADASGAVRLTESQSSVHPSFAPDDAAIYYGSQANGSTQVWGMLPDGRGKEQKTNGLGPGYPEANVPEWSRDGVLVFWSGIENNFGEVWTLDLSTSEGPQRRTTTVDPHYSDNPTWSPDGTTILFDSDRSGAGVSIHAMQADGTNVRELLAGASGQSAWQPVAAGGPPIQRGLTGLWYEPATAGQGFAFEVYPAVATGGDGSVFGGWFTFDAVAGSAATQRWYSVGGPARSEAGVQALTIYRNVGGNFAAGPVTTAQAVGSAALAFTSCGSAWLDYQFSDGTGRTGRIDLTRLTPDLTCAAAADAPADADFDLSGFWHDPATSGQGVFIEINNAASAAVVAWYTYAPGGQAAGVAGQRWYTAQAAYTAGARRMTLPLFETIGGVFDAPSTPGPATASVGEAILDFSDCTHATLAYAFAGGSSVGLSGTLALERVGPAPAGCQR